MNAKLRGIVKEGLMFGIAAALLALTTPLLAAAVVAMTGTTVAAGATTAVSIAALDAAHPAIWLGSYFGVFGALFAGVKAVSTIMFNGNHENAPIAASKSCTKTPNVVINNTQVQPNIAIDAQANLYTQLEEARRAAGQSIVRQ